MWAEGCAGGVCHSPAEGVCRRGVAVGNRHMPWEASYVGGGCCRHRYTQGKKGAKSENTPMEASQGTRRPPTATPSCRETGDIRYTNEKTVQKVRTPLRPHRKPPRTCGGSQQRHSSSGLPSRSHQTNCEGSHVDNPGVRKGPKRGFRRLPSKDYERGWVQGFEGTLETGGARGSGWKLPIRQIGANENIHARGSG